MFQWVQKRISTFYVILPYLHDTVSLDPSRRKKKTHLLYIINTMGADVLGTYGPLARYIKLRVRMHRECRERFPRHHS